MNKKVKIQGSASLRFAVNRDRALGVFLASQICSLDWSLGKKEESKGTKPNLKDDSSSSHVLVVDEFHGVVSLLYGVVAEPFGETRQGNVVTIEVGCLKCRICAL